MSNIVDLPTKDITYVFNENDEIIAVAVEIEGEIIEFNRNSLDKRYISDLCIAWLLLEEPNFSITAGLANENN